MFSPQCFLSIITKNLFLLLKKIKKITESAQLCIEVKPNETAQLMDVEVEVRSNLHQAAEVSSF